MLSMVSISSVGIKSNKDTNWFTGFPDEEEEKLRQAIQTCSIEQDRRGNLEA